MKNIVQSVSAGICNKSNANSDVPSKDTHWNPMDSDDIFEPGGTLMAWLLHEARTQVLTTGQLASELGVELEYLSALRTGAERTVDVSAEFAAAAARFLGVPMIVIKVANGQVRASDFMMPSADCARNMTTALKKIQADPMFGALLPQEAFSASAAIQHFIIQCYQEASGQEIWPYRSLPTFLQFLQRAALIQEEREQEVMARKASRRT